jgi:2,3-diketo-5-methylthio-1-phosphopentane phosphatase
VCTDFDGTVSRRDVGYHLYHRFSGGKSDEVLPDWKAGRISSRECLSREAAMVQATPEEIYTFLDGFQLDPGFVEFEQLCRRTQTPLLIVSDGLDFYIRHILGNHDLAHIPISSNIGRLSRNGLAIEFPYPPGACGRCGNCKGERLEEYRRRYRPERVVFVGDGLSDTCAVTAADIVLAKKDLSRYCAAEEIPYTLYNTFHDVSRYLVGTGYLSIDPGMPERRNQ